MYASSRISQVTIVCLCASCLSCGQNQSPPARTIASTATVNQPASPRPLNNAEWIAKLRTQPSLRACPSGKHELSSSAARTVQLAAAPCTDGESVADGSDFYAAHSYELSGNVITVLEMDASGGGREPLLSRYLFRQWPDGREGIVGSVESIGPTPDIRVTRTAFEVRFDAYIVLDDSTNPEIWIGGPSAAARRNPDRKITSVYRGDLDSLVLAERQTEVFEKLPATVEARRPELNGAITEISRIALAGSMTRSDRQQAYRVLQDNVGHALFAEALRRVPIYDERNRGFKSFDAVAREFVSSNGGAGDSPIERDPVGATLKLFFDPRAETIQSMLGLPR